MRICIKIKDSDLRRILRNILYTLITLISVSAIAHAGRGAFYGMEQSETPEALEDASSSIAEEDSLPKVRKTDYKNGEEPRKYAFDFKDPDNLNTDASEYDEKSGYYKVGSKLGDNFLTFHPTLQLSVKDTEDAQTHEPIVATAEMLNAANGKSRLGCTVAAKFSRQFADEVSWQKVDPQAAAAASGEEDITEGGENQGGENQGGGNGGGGNNNPPGELEG